MEGTVNVMTEVNSLLRAWEEEMSQPQHNPVPTLNRLAEIIELETDNYVKMDPDPFDERHPSRTDPDCKLGQILKALFRKDIFMNKLVNDYLRDSYYSRLSLIGRDRDIDQLNIAACRLMLDIMPGLETSVVFQPDMDALVHRLIKWAIESVEPLQSYATGLVAAAMEIPELATRFRDQNITLVPLMLQRLRRLRDHSDFMQSILTTSTNTNDKNRQSPGSSQRHFARFAKSPPSVHVNNEQEPNTSADILSPPESRTTMANSSNILNVNKKRSLDECSSNSDNQNVSKRPKYDFGELMSPPHRHGIFSNESSNSNWAELTSFVIGTIQIFPPTQATRQMFILRYLTPMGEYQEHLSHVFENNALELILSYVNVRETKQARLAFEALKYLAALLCHKKFSIEFIQTACGGLEALLDVPRPSIAATGVSICLYYLGYCEEAMERVCLLPKQTISELVGYALWLLECSHDSGRCHATMFFALTFQFKVILDEFDKQDGLRKLHNVIATLPILTNDSVSLNEDAECAARQIVRHVCVAYKKYLEAHLHVKVEHLRRTMNQHQYSGASNTKPSTSTGYSGTSHLLPSSSTFNSNQQSHSLTSLSALSSSSSSTVSAHSNKVGKLSVEDIQQQIDTLMQLIYSGYSGNVQHQSRHLAHWHPVDQMLKLGAITLLLKVIAFAYEWNYSGRAETVRSALDALAIACIVPKVQMLLCERVDLPGDEGLTLGISIILGAAEGEIVGDADVQKAALRVIVNCVCVPMPLSVSVGNIPSSATSTFNGSINLSPQKSNTPGTGTGTLSSNSTPSIKHRLCSNDELIQRVWDCVRTNSGIMVLLQLMKVKTPITDADCIRTLACKALAGLARSGDVRQIVSKLPIFQNGHLQSLMRDPILQEKRQEHVTFQKYALELLERISGKIGTNNNQQSNNDTDVSLQNIHRASIVAQTKIQFNDKQLLQLIHQHLMNKGLVNAASTLQQEANLLSTTSLLKSSGYLLGNQTSSNGGGTGSGNSSTSLSLITNHPSKFRYPNPATPTRMKITFSNHSSSSIQRNLSNSGLQQTHSVHIVDTPPPPPSQYQNQINSSATGHTQNNVSNSTNIASNVSSTPSTNLPGSIRIIKKAQSNPSISTNILSPVSISTNVSRLQKQIGNESILLQQSTTSNSIANTLQSNDLVTIDQRTNNSITLDSIITEYLTNQHALCRNPMATCPQFNLFVPHKCPDPRPRVAAAGNFIVRYARSQMGCKRFSAQSARLDRRLVHTRFCPVQTIRLPVTDQGEFFTCVRFMPGDQSLCVGNYAGEIRFYGIRSGSEEAMFQAHDSYICNIQPARAGEILLSSATWGRPLSALWNLKEFEIKLSLDEDEHVEFSNLTQDKIIGTRAEKAIIYDVTTGRRISRFTPTISNQYTKNKATFSPHDDLVLSDGVLFDVMSGKQIHKLDKLNQTQNGVFHPNGLEIVSNTEVWDLRTFHLLKTVPSLNQCAVQFAPYDAGIAIYATSLQKEDQDEEENETFVRDPETFETSFKTLDAFDYSAIATVDVKRNIYSLAANRYDTQIAIVENQGVYHSVQESVVRLYDVGRHRDAEDEEEEDDEDEQEDEEDDDDDEDDDEDDDDDASDSDSDTRSGDDDEDDDNNDDMTNDDSNPNDATQNTNRDNQVEGDNSVANSTRNNEENNENDRDNENSNRRVASSTNNNNNNNNTRRNTNRRRNNIRRNRQQRNRDSRRNRMRNRNRRRSNDDNNVVNNNESQNNTTDDEDASSWIDILSNIDTDEAVENNDENNQNRNDRNGYLDNNNDRNVSRQWTSASSSSSHGDQNDQNIHFFEL